MRATRVPAMHRHQAIVSLVVLVGFMLAMVAPVGLRPAEADTPVQFLSEKLEGTLVDGETGYVTKEAIAVTIQNTGTEPAKIGFCALPKGESDKCPGAEPSIQITITEPITDPLVIGPGTVMTLKLVVEVSVDPTKEEDEGLAEQKGLLILQADDTDVATIPYTLTPETRNDNPYDYLTPLWVILGGLAIAVLAVAFSIWLVCTGKDGLPFWALLTLPMGIAEWKIDSSWAANLALALAVLGGIEGVLPESAKAFKTSHGSLVFLFGAITLAGAFVYNATTYAGPEKEKDKDEYKKQGWTGVFLLTSLLIVWSLLGQLGLQMMTVEEVRDAGKEIPKIFLVALEVGLLFLLLFAIRTTVVKLRDTILDQKIKEHKDAYQKRTAYKDAIDSAHDFAKKCLAMPTLPQPKEILEGFAKAVPKLHAPPDKDYLKLSALFHENLPLLLNRIASSTEDCKKLVELIESDAKEAQGLLKQTLPFSDVVAAFYSSLWVPADLRKKHYLETIDKTIRHVEVACAQAQSAIEPDMVLGPNQELFTNMTATLKELNKAFGMAGDRDPFYANLKKLTEIAEKKWEVLPIHKLAPTLCWLANSPSGLAKCRSDLQGLYQVKGADLATWLDCLAGVLGNADAHCKPDAGGYTEAQMKESMQRLAMALEASALAADFDGPPQSFTASALVEWLEELAVKLGLDFPSDVTKDVVVAWLLKPATALDAEKLGGTPPESCAGPGLSAWLNDLAEALDTRGLYADPESNDTGKALAMSLEPLARALGEPVPYPTWFPVDVKEWDENKRLQNARAEREAAVKAAQRARSKLSVSTLKEIQPFAGWPSLDDFEGPGDEDAEEVAAQAMVKLQQIMDGLETSGYSSPDEESNRERRQALRDNSRLKVQGKNVRLL